MPCQFWLVCCPDTESDFPPCALFVTISDPESEVPFAQALYSSDSFMRAFFNSLSDDGILVMQLGQAPEPWYPDETHSKYKNRALTTSFLEGLGFDSIHAYEDVSNIRRSSV